MEVVQCQEIREFNRLYKELDDIYHSVSASHGISDTVFIILYSVYALGEGCSQKDIADFYFLPRQTINSAVKKLYAEHKVVLRTSKGREQGIYLTSEGRAFADEIILPVLRAENAAFADMGREEKRLFLELNRKFNALLKEKLTGKHGGEK